MNESGEQREGPAPDPPSSGQASETAETAQSGSLLSSPTDPGAPASHQPSQPPAGPGQLPAGPGQLPASPQPSGTMWASGPTNAGGTSGCVKLVFVLIILFAIAGVVLFVFLGSFVNNLRVGEGGSVGTDCPFLSDADARAVLGGNADATELAGLFDVSIGIVIDKRVLPEAPDCFVSEGQAAYLARVALYQGGDATGVFAAERQRAAPSSEDQGGGLTLENQGFFGGDVTGLGDEAFCTGLSDAIMAGVLVRQGDRVAYVSVGPPSEGEQVPDMNTTPDGVVTSPGLCALAQDLARRILD